MIGGRIQLLSIVFTLFGLALQQCYLVYVGELSFFMFIIGVIIASTGIVLSFIASDKDPKLIRYTLLLVCLMYFSLVIMPFVRFRALSGDDMLYEFVAAESTEVHGWNTFASIQSLHADPGHTAYLSCVGVTILPSIIHEITGLGLVDVMKFVLSVIVSLTPVLIYINAKEIFSSQKLAVLSSIIFSESYFAFSSVNVQGMRQSIAVLFVLLAFFTIARLIGTRGRKAYFIMLVFSLFGIFSNHYTTAYLSIGLFFFLMVSSHLILKAKTLRRLLKVEIRFQHKQFSPVTFCFIFLLISFLTWSFAIPSSPFPVHLSNLAGLLNPKTVPIPDNITTKFALSGSPLGPWVDNWLRLGVILSFLGFLSLLLRKKDLKKFLWLVGSGMFFGLFLFVTFVPSVSTLYGGILRVYVTGFFFFCVLEAIALLELSKKLKGILLIFLFLNLPIQMLLPVNQRYVLYHPEESVSPFDAVSNIYATEAEFAAASWMKSHVPAEEYISVDYRGYVNLYYANHFLFRSTTGGGDYLYSSRYMWFHQFALEYGLWFEKDGTKTFNSSLAIAKSNIIYNDKTMLLMKP